MNNYVRADLQHRGAAPFGPPWQISGEVVRAVKNRATIRFEADGRTYYLKRHGRVDVREVVKNLVVGKWPVIGADREYRACRYLHNHGMVVPRVAQFGTIGTSPLNRRSFVVCDALDGYQSLELLLDSGGAAKLGVSLRRRLARELGRLVGELHGFGVNHRDLYVCHCFYRIESLEKSIVELGLIDLHRAQIRSRTPWRWRVRDIGALLFSCRDYAVSPLEQACFVRAYERALGSIETPRFWRAIERRAESLSRREARRQSRREVRRVRRTAAK